MRRSDPQFPTLGIAVERGGGRQRYSVTMHVVRHILKISCLQLCLVHELRRGPDFGIGSKKPSDNETKPFLD